MSANSEAAKPPKTTVAARLRQIGRLLPTAHWTYLLSLLLPLFALDLVFKVIRIRAQSSAPGPLGFVDEIRSDVFFNAALLVLWVGAFALARRVWLRALLLLVLHVSVILLLLLTAAGHFYYMKTGSLLETDTVVEFFTTFNQIRGAIAVEMGPIHWALLFGTIGYGLFGPALITRIVQGQWLPVLPKGRRRRPLTHFASVALVTGSAMALVLLSALPSFNGASAFSRNSVVNMAVNSVQAAWQRPPGGYVPPTRADIPDQTRLVKTAQTKKRNVVMIFMESERFKSTSLSDPSLATTPYLSELAKNSLVAQNAYAVLPHTSKSITAGNCGVEPPFDSENTEAEPNGLAAKCLPTLLKEQGYKSVFFQSATEKFERRRMLVHNFGYDEFYPLEDLSKAGYNHANYFGYEDDIMLKPSRDWALKHKNRPFLMTYLTVTSHHNYRVPADFPAQHLSDDPVLNNYLNTVRYQDRFVKQVINQYKKMGLYDNTIFVVMADHGEGFGEHGRKQHDDTIYNEGIKIPLLIHDPTRFKGGKTIETPVQNLAILPTVADLLGYDISGGHYRTTSMLDKPTNRPLMVSCFHEDRCLAYIKGSKKFIYHFGNRPDEFFDLAADPNETHNIIGEQNKAEINQIRTELLRWQAKVKATYALQRGSK